VSHQAIGDYGVIGNMRTTALVGMNGSLDWFCYPRFDSPSVFAAALDAEKGGFFCIAPTLADGIKHKQFYWPETNVLVTRFLSEAGVGQITDFMPIPEGEGESHHHAVVRQLRVVRGTMTFRIECRPVFDHVRTDHQVTLVAGGARFDSPKLSLALSTDVPLERDGPGVVSTLQLQAGESAVFVLRGTQPGAGCSPLATVEAEHLFRRTVEYWRVWLSRCTYQGRWREEVHRSALVLKLLTYEPTGAIVAAPSRSLSENPGGERTRDCRYTWIRDGAYTLCGLLRIGFMDEATRLISWLEDRCQELNEDGSYAQLRLDIYGALMQAIHLYDEGGPPISYDLWQELRQLLNRVCDNWQREQHGIWQAREDRRHFVYSKLMCWVALDRGLALADKRSFPAERDRWLRERDRLYEEIMQRGWSRARHSFVQSYDSDHLDATSLIMPLVHYLSPTDPRMLDTLDAIDRSPRDGGLVEDGLVYRCDRDDGLAGPVGRQASLNMCSFWLVEALSRAGAGDRRRLAAARLTFEQMLGYANHLGLYAEETGPCGEALGNFPHVAAHLALISAACELGA